ncbi:YeeE/YedE thiosulfate transporter family protein [Polynucleobacter sp. MG-28-Ekke-A2]|uniref:YeeE/YedE family protein n=1 Tax=Polynucleobacter sp. MG-28-Ekke-A2 TaxID=3108276 RepID=UPI002B23E5F7|nr:YeeE/YedE thiosulfate transporter family protein [Polynucleobacter sp. MG-28-Ekke-A2]MEA9601545.1 YeeE/YedE thiosulfate transporter family protein [Polynucleobacter sp. MG-28-Ekke-A2]
MQIDWFSFTPIPSLLGGMILGIAAALYVLLHGRILGISGIVSGLLHPKLTDTAWRLSLVLGLVSAPFMAALFFGIFPVVEIESDWIAIVIAGILVGFGAHYGSGCTSGHGICGLSRLSPRSLVATCAFMFAGFVTVFILRHLIGV